MVETRIIVRDAGPRGDGAARQLYNADIIPEPTVEAMDARYLAAGESAVTAQKGTADGIAPLDGDAKIPMPFIPRDWAGDPINALDYGFSLDDETDETARLYDLLERQRLTGRPLILPPGFYAVISDDFLIDWDGFRFQMAKGAVIRQATHGRGFLRTLTGTAEASIHGVRVKYVGERTPLTERYRGYTAFQRMCALWHEGEAAEISGIEASNMYVGLVLRGPVERYPDGAGYTGADTDPNTAYDYRPQASSNEVNRVRARDCDFAITGNQQVDGQIDDYVAWDVTKTISTVPPHAIYMTNPGVDELKGKMSRMTVTRGRCVRNPYGTGHKFISHEDSTFDQLFSFSTPGGLLLEAATGVRVGLVSLQDQIEGSNPNYPEKWGIYAYDVVGQIDNVSVSMHEDAEAGLIYVSGTAPGACNLEVNDASVISRFPETSTNAAIVRAERYAVIRVNNAYHNCAGHDIKEFFVAKDASRIIATNFRTTGSNKLANAEPAAGEYSGASIHLNYDPLQVDGWDANQVNTGASSDDVTEVRQGATAQFSWGSAMTVYGTSSAGTNSYSGRIARVHRVGDLVWIFGRLALSGALSSTGDLRIGPLPYAAAGTGSDADVSAPLSSWNAITVEAGGQLMAAVLDGENFIRLQIYKDGARSNVAHGIVGSGLRVEFALFYRTSDPV